MYEEQSKTAEMDALVRKHTVLVMKIAKHIKRKLPHYIELNDLVQAGFIGLIEASKTFKPDQGASFETFSAIRIKGSIIDDLRKNSWNSRDAIENLKKIGDAVHRVEQRYQRAATSEEIAQEMNVSVEEHYKICQKINICNVVSMETLNSHDTLPCTEDNPEQAIINDNLKDRIKQLLLTLPEREKILLSLYYIESLTFKEISDVLDLTEARVCQLHATAIAKLKTRLG